MAPENSRTAEDLNRLPTEQPHPAAADLDTRSPLEIVTLMNDLDHTVAPAVRQALPQIAQAVEIIADRLAQGGRLLYFGAGTSGRLGMLDAVECGPTFNLPPEVVRAFVAGGPAALIRSVEGAEDDAAAGAAQVAAAGVGEKDVVVGITASGRTPYVLAAVQEAKRRGATTVGLACNRNTPLRAVVDLAIEVETGPELISGSTRLKAGTAQKMVLNMLSTAALIRRHKVFGNLMVDLQATNLKLRTRAVRLVQQAAGVDEAAARSALEAGGWSAKTAILMLLRGLDAETARRHLEAQDGSLRAALAGG
ncbi:MAG TPA: N-acetylmuramic acid 6-phosphate etherase, partial [Armatimonadetes bacterium]|nr:N-acetylmuramic acid 6-phosphate etherase [Armatimonadota bacterium]